MAIRYRAMHYSASCGKKLDQIQPNSQGNPSSKPWAEATHVYRFVEVLTSYT